MHTGDIIQWIVIVILALWVFILMCIVYALSVKIERVLESKWF